MIIEKNKLTIEFHDASSPFIQNEKWIYYENDHSSRKYYNPDIIINISLIV